MITTFSIIVPLVKIIFTAPKSVAEVTSLVLDSGMMSDLHKNKINIKVNRNPTHNFSRFFCKQMSTFIKSGFPGFYKKLRIRKGHSNESKCEERKFLPNRGTKKINSLVISKNTTFAF